MTTLEIVAIVLVSISFISGGIFVVSWLASVLREKVNTSVHFVDFYAVLRSSKAAREERWRYEDLEGIATMVRKNSGVPLVRILNNPRKRFYLFQALSNPSENPWGRKRR